MTAATILTWLVLIQRREAVDAGRGPVGMDRIADDRDLDQQELQHDERRHQHHQRERTVPTSDHVTEREHVERPGYAEEHAHDRGHGDRAAAERVGRPRLEALHRTRSVPARPRRPPRPRDAREPLAEQCTAAICRRQRRDHHRDRPDHEEQGGAEPVAAGARDAAPVLEDQKHGDIASGAHGDRAEVAGDEQALGRRAGEDHHHHREQLRIGGGGQAQRDDRPHRR